MLLQSESKWEDDFEFYPICDVKNLHIYISSCQLTQILVWFKRVLRLVHTKFMFALNRKISKNISVLLQLNSEA